jgi:tetratricopeptide (TPR) repeat protein
MAKSSSLTLLLGSVVALIIAGYFGFVYKGALPNPPQHAASELTSDYVPPETCSGCHAEIAAGYAETGMAQAFYAATPEAMAHLGAETTFEHRKSGRVYEILQHDDAYFMRRHETGPGGSAINVFEKRIDYVMGSGNHARTYIHQYPNGKLVEMPVGWYSENGGFLAMSPGFDASAHADFRREIPFDCLGCHNGLSSVRGKTFKRSEDPLLTGDLSGGIGCQRCHGPGRAHVEAVAKGADAAAIHAAIFNPARQNRDRQLEVCMQCHLETTSRRLPYSVARFDRDPFSYKPSEPLEDFILHFDYAEGVKEDRFEIAHAAYRLRKSACFLNSEMTCTTCHDPHRVVRGEAAKTYFANACKTCHAGNALAQIPNHANAADCQTCHMPKRRTDDVVHVVMTDHYIQRRPPDGDLLAPIEEVTEGPGDVYHGPVEPYYPAQIGSDPEDQLYLAVAQVAQQTNLQAGIKRLRELIEKYQPEQADFYFQLAEAYWNQQKLDEALVWYKQAVQHDPKHLIALRNYATVLAEAGKHTEAEQVVRQALEVAPGDPKGLNNLGDVLVTLGRAAAAIPVLTKSLEGDPDSPEALQNLARAYGETGDTAKAVEAARQAIRVQPDFDAAHNTLANLLVEQGQLAEAEQEFRKALELDPKSAIAHYNYANLLVAREQFSDAERQLREAIRLAPTMAAGHRNLGNLLGMRGDAEGAERMFRRAIELDPNDSESHYNLGNALAAQQRIPEASQSYRKAVELRPRYDQARVNFAITLYTLGDETAAREEAAKIADPVLRGRAQQAMIAP